MAQVGFWCKGTEEGRGGGGEAHGARNGEVRLQGAVCVHDVM